ncbi:ImpA-related N-terminal family protein [Moritella viscosa]|uniref:type VI secretion system ImpA family N-terminal domain-containing protein n=1 Tax=Moritella viscosa TaxID=80854 RepID=UPI000910C5B8|nr:type VI secretion system ImpA family N-terminal domain-containing protein [Moritella viscosa]SGZ02968.1 ImpA-related N-terminal family protein [Moritella viscosa]
MYFSDFTRRPIDKSSPEGEDTNQLDTFTELKRQVNELNRISSNVSWKKIHSLSVDILTNQSKDFRSACYYTTAATHIHGLKGLVDGLSAIYDLTLVYWYSAYPEYNKEKARIGAFEWMIEHTTKRQKKMAINVDDLQLIEIGHRLTLKIEEELKSHYGIKTPSLSPIRRILSQWIEELKETQIKQDQQAKKSSQNVEDLETIIDVNTSTTTSLPEIAEIPVTVSRPKPKVVYKKKPIIICILIVIFIMFFGFKHYQQQKLLQTFKNANFDDFSSLIQELTHSPKSTQQELKEVVFNKSTVFFKNWSEDPLKINKLNTLTSIINALKGVYSDSIIYQSLEHNFYNDKNNLINSYSGIKQQFNRARTIIANAQLTSQSSSITKSYKFSNTLFPLLARIEYAENSMDDNDIKKAQYILNVYQLRINSLTSKVSE